MRQGGLPKRLLPHGLRFEPLVSECRRVDAVHLSLLGSARKQPLGEVSDVDFHLVVSRVDRGVFSLVAAAAEETVRQLAAKVERPWRLELRHGPFKPAPGAARDLQCHVVLDDVASLRQSTCAVIAQRAANGILLAGEELAGRRLDSASVSNWLAEAQAELSRWRQALAGGEIPFRHWLFDPEPRLADERVTAATGWDLMCLLQGAARASDLHYRAAALAACAAEEEALARPLLSQLGEEPDWTCLAERWGTLSGRAIALVERRLEHLFRIRGALEA